MANEAAGLTGFVPNEWTWSAVTMDNITATLPSLAGGDYNLDLWMREDGLRVDKVLLTTDPDYIPSGEGPPESARQTITGTTTLQSVVIAYDYDPLYRLTEAIYTGDITGTYSYDYDAVGNRQTYTVTLTTTEVTTYTYNAANQLETAKLNTSADTWYYVYDGNGNQVRQVPNGLTPAAGEVRYTFDQRNRLVRIENHDGSDYQIQGEAVYDGEDQRVQAMAYMMGVPMTTTYTLDRRNNGAALVVNDGSSDTLILYGLFGLGEYSSEWHYYLGDGQFSLRQLANATGDVTLARTYDPFGGLLHQAGEGDALFGFMGTQTGGNGLLYINGRYYDPASGRFLSPDSSNFDPMRPGTLNGYLAAVFLANPGGLLFGPLLILNWRRRKGSKGTYTVLLLLGVGLGVTLAGCGGAGTSAPATTPNAGEIATGTHVATTPEPAPLQTPAAPTGTPLPPPVTLTPQPTTELPDCPTPITALPTPTQTALPTSTPRPVLTPSSPLLPSTPPAGLDVYGQSAWNGLQVIQSQKGAWWENELDAQEAMIIFLNEEFGNLYGADLNAPNSLPPATVAATANRYNAFCSDGPWSTRCIDDFWGYSEVIREPDVQLFRGGGRYDQRHIIQEITNIAINILNHNVAGSPEPFHWANILDDETAAITYVEWLTGGRTYVEWVYPYTDASGNIISIFAVQTTSQHNLTGRLDLWRR